MFVIAIVVLIVVTVLNEVCVRKRFFLRHQFVVRLVLAHEAGGNVRATRALVDEFVRVFADRTADRRQCRIRVVVGDDRVWRCVVFNPIDESLEQAT